MPDPLRILGLRLRPRPEPASTPAADPRPTPPRVAPWLQLTRTEQEVVGHWANWMKLTEEQRAVYLLLSRLMKSKNVSLEGLKLQVGAVGRSNEQVGRIRMFLVGDAREYKRRLEASGWFKEDDSWDPFHAGQEWAFREKVEKDSVHTGAIPAQGRDRNRKDIIFLHIDQFNPRWGVWPWLEHSVEVAEDGTRGLPGGPYFVPSPWQIARKIGIELG